MFDALTFLNNLYRPEAETPISPADLPTEWHFLWDERAAIMEYDGGLPRERAEALALAEIVQRMRQGVDVNNGQA